MTRARFGPSYVDDTVTIVPRRVSLYPIQPSAVTTGNGRLRPNRTVRTTVEKAHSLAGGFSSWERLMRRNANVPRIPTTKKYVQTRVIHAQSNPLNAVR